MQTLALALAALAAAGTAAEPPTAPAAAPTPQFSASDVIPDRPGYEDAFALYELKLGGEEMSAADQTTRWLNELKAGRARAGALVGSNLSYLALTESDCAAARDALTRADELGSDQAAWQLVQLANNRSCGEPDIAATERWLKKAVTLDYQVAAQRLIELYSPAGAKTDPVQQYVYARVAGGYAEAVYGKESNPGSRAGFDVADLQAMEKTLSAADRKRAETEATQILTQMLKRHDRFKPAQAQEFSRGGKAEKASSGWGFAAYTLDYLVAAQGLIELYSPTGAKTDPVQQYVYARVAGGYAESVYGKESNPGSRAGFDVADLQAMEKNLSAADRKRAETEATQILTQMLKRHDRFKPAQAQEFSRGGKAEKASSGWGFAAYTIDYHHECAWNLAGNCRGAQRLAYVDIVNNEKDFMSCKAEVKSKDFVTGAVGSLSREVLIGPKVTRRLVVGDVYEQPDKGSVTVNCKAVPKLAENAAAGKCRARLEGSIDAQQFYPASARNAGIEGDVVVRYWVPPGSTVAVDAEIARSSGHEALDDAAIDTIRTGKFTKECDYGLSSVRIAFKLQD